MRVRSLESRILGARPSESMSPGLALLNGEIFPYVGIVSQSEIDTIYAHFASNFGAPPWFPYGAIAASANFMIIGYETNNGFGVQMKLSHLSDIPPSLRAKRSGSWGGWTNI